VEKHKIILNIMLIATLGVGLTSCTKKTASITVNNINTGTTDGDVNGNGGDASHSYDWINLTTQATYAMDLTSSVGGTFNLTVKDASGNVMLDRTLTAGVGDDSASGVSSIGQSGTWMVIITLTDFEGDGSYSVDS